MRGAAPALRFGPFARTGRYPREVSARQPVAYEVVAGTRAGKARLHRYASEEPLVPGGVLRLDGRYWLVDGVEPGGEPIRVSVKPARYRIRLRHPDGREEPGAFRRFRPDAPRLGHGLTTLEDGRPVSWQVVGEGLAHDEQGEPYLDLIAERDYGELEELPDHQLEHALAAREERLPEAVTATLSQADSSGLAVELVALEPGELPEWDAARRYIDALTLDEIEDDLLELCGVDPDRDPREAWLEIVQARLRADLASFRTDVEENHDEIEEWDFLDGRIFAGVGSSDDEADPDSGYGRLCRLVDVSALTSAGFRRVRKPELELSE
jgi:hypothetical protein